MARGGSRGTQRERENRAVTLVAVFRNVASVAIVGGGVLMALDEVGIPIMPLMGGAAVLGLAVAFGAQNLVRDYFSGFMVLMEDQYGINDVVRIGDIVRRGRKDHVARDRAARSGGHRALHTARQHHAGQQHDARLVASRGGDQYLVQGRHGLRDERADGRRQASCARIPTFGPLILDEPEMLGLDRFGDSSVVIKFVLKTHPLKRWPVRRELLRRIKRKFDELGIEIPFPQRTVYNRQESETPVARPTGIARPCTARRPSSAAGLIWHSLDAAGIGRSAFSLTNEPARWLVGQKPDLVRARANVLDRPDGDIHQVMHQADPDDVARALHSPKNRGASAAVEHEERRDVRASCTLFGDLTGHVRGGKQQRGNRQRRGRANQPPESHETKRQGDSFEKDGRKVDQLVGGQRAEIRTSGKLRQLAAQRQVDRHRAERPAPRPSATFSDKRSDDRKIVSSPCRRAASTAAMGE